MTKEHGEQAFPRPPFKYSAARALFPFSGRHYLREPEFLGPALFKIKTWMPAHCEECQKEVALNVQTVSTQATDEQLAAVGAFKRAVQPEEARIFLPSEPIRCQQCYAIPKDFSIYPRY